MEEEHIPSTRDRFPGMQLSPELEAALLLQEQGQLIKTRGGLQQIRKASDGSIVTPSGAVMDEFEAQSEFIAPDKDFSSQLLVNQNQDANRTITPPPPGSNKKLPSNTFTNALQAASIVGPAAFGIANLINQDRSGLVPKADEVSLTTPTVRSARAPRITTKFRRPTGSSLAEREAGIKFRDVQNESRRQEFDRANDQFIQQQIGRNAEIKNKEAYINSSTRNRRNLVKAQLQNAKLERQQTQANSLISDSFANAVNFSNQRTAGDAALRGQLFETMATSDGMTIDQINDLATKLYGRRAAKFLS